MSSKSFGCLEGTFFLICATEENKTIMACCGKNLQNSMILFSFCTRENPSPGLKMERRKNRKFIGGFRMEDHEGQSAKNLASERKYFAARNEFMALTMCSESVLKHGHSTASQDF